MRKTLLFLLLGSVKLTFGQLNDDFADGNFTLNPGWTGSTAFFQINAVKQLQTTLSNTAQTVHLRTPNFLATNVKWEFMVKLNFDPSTTNQLRIYLVSDQPNLDAALNGYFIQIGESGSADSYDLYRQSGTTVTKIIDGPPKTRSDVNTLLARIQVTRNDAGKWELFTDISGGTNYVPEGSTTDLTFTGTDWFGVSCKYTATRSDGFIFDDFSITELVPDITPPALVNAKALDGFTIEATFSERLQNAEALLPGNYLLSKMGNPAAVKSTNLTNVYQLVYANELPSGDYKLTVKGVKDLKGNLISTNNSVDFFYLKPYTLKKGDILISEVLFNPRPGGVDFVEIYNNTNQVLDLSALQLANADASRNAANIKNVSTSPLYMPPKTYWVLTTNPSAIAAQYNVKFTSQMVKMASLPSYNNDKGSVILLTLQGILEQFDYSEKMHQSLLQNADGVSLERISFTKPANEAGNFSSTAAANGFATPTAANSLQENNIDKNSVVLSSKIFSPDGDGFEDELGINYHFANSGNFATVTIYTDRGILVRQLQKNITIPAIGKFTWDGLNDAGSLEKIGIYIIKFDVFALNGKTESYKRLCVLAAKLK